MTIRIKQISPVQAAKMLAAFYALFSLILIPIMLLIAVFSSNGPSVLIAIVFPLLYIVFGFIGGLIGAFLYNLVAGWIGGLEITFHEVGR